MMGKITDYSNHSNAAAEDLILIVDDPEGSPVTKKMTLGAFFANVSSNATFTDHLISSGTFIIKKVSPIANSSVEAIEGTVSFDSDYLYITTSNNVTKRIAFETF